MEEAKKPPRSVPLFQVSDEYCELGALIEQATIQRELYEAYVQVGFSDEQAFKLLLTNIESDALASIGEEDNEG